MLQGTRPSWTCLEEQGRNLLSCRKCCMCEAGCSLSGEVRSISGSHIHVLPAESSNEELWSLYEDVYLCAVLVCCVGLLCMCLFTLVVCCQYLQRKRRLKGGTRQMLKLSFGQEPTEQVRGKKKYHVH
ncbi:hypothetical protein DNTS_033179 [Danionella cerebrum]|uniref:Uncharacterized protein n=1 Tax=Danionella cerebrum TaxID=2873325 RepID=A0A553RLF7_9TELE|nr:hypothetical protein DNTS_033179 [Danionella translucida]